MTGIILVTVLQPILWPSGFGLSQKTFWDWLELLIIPLSLVIFSFFLQNRQKNQEDKQRELLRERERTQQQEQNRRDEEKAKEEVIQIYFDRISTLLINGELLSIASRERHEVTEEQLNQLNAAKAVIRARTLSVLRRFSDDGERKSSVVRFLIETEVISKIGVRLSHADLGEANLMFADLSGTVLNGANMSKADLTGADLSRADLSNADLRNANIGNSSLAGCLLFSTNLSNSILVGADLSSAQLSGAILSGSIVDLANFDNAVLKGTALINTDLSLSHVTLNQISQALLCNTILPKGMALDSNRDCEKFEVDFQKVEG
nr:pentapeptide repeat-containing protein [Nodosilinea sp. LEGE 06152]